MQLTPNTFQKFVNLSFYHWQLTECRKLIFLIITGDKEEKSVNGKKISIGKFPPGERDYPFLEIPLIPEMSTGTNEKVAFHLHPNRNGKRSE